MIDRTANLAGSRSRSSRRRLRFSLRAAMGLVLVLGCALGWVVHRASVRRDAVAAIRAAGGSVAYDRDLTRTLYAYGEYFQPTPLTTGQRKWRDDRLGPDYFGNVKTISLGPRSTDATMAQVGRLAEVEEINAADCGITDAGLVHLRGLPLLRSFGVSRSGGVTGAGLIHLAESTRLTRLALGLGPTRDADLIHLRKLVNLRMLRFYAAGGVTDAGMRHLAGLVDLRELIILRSAITGRGLAALSGMRAMDRLVLRGNRIESLEALRPLTKLTGLWVHEAPLDDAGLAPVADLASLRYLVLDDTRVTGAGLQGLVGLGKLLEVSVENCPVTDAGAAAFRRARPLVGLFR